MPEQRSGDGWELRAPLDLAILLLLVAWVPVSHTSMGDEREIAYMLVAGFGVLFTAGLYSVRTTGFSVTLYPCFQALLALTGHTFLQEMGFALTAFLGMTAYNVRIGRSLPRAAGKAMGFAVGTLLVLRLVTVGCGALGWIERAPFHMLLLRMLAATGAAALLNCLVRQLTRLPSMGRPLLCARHLPLPLVFSPFMVPAVMDLSAPSGPAWSLPLVAGTLGLIAVQASLTLSVTRSSARSLRTMAMERELARFPGMLSSLRTPLEALREFAMAWYRGATPRALTVRWRGSSFSYPPSPSPPEGEPLVHGSGEGLLMEIWPSLDTVLDPARLEVFTAQAETVLRNLELRKRVEREGWRCLEAMVYSLDRSDSRQTGYSEQVASTALSMGMSLGMEPDELESLEMAAMLHLTAPILAKAEADWQEAFSMLPSRGQFELPPDVARAVRHVNENYDGSGGPDGLSGAEIPLASRIISVAATWVRRSDAGAEPALTSIRHRSGTIYDPDIVRVLGETVLPEGG